MSVVVFPVLANYTASFPVRINNNVLKGISLFLGQWIGFTLEPIGAFPFDQPIEPRDSSGNIVRFPFEITNNTMIKTPGSTSAWTLVVWGWGNDLSPDPDPDMGGRNIGGVYQYVVGDNGPVLISGNHIEMASTSGEAIVLGATNAGVSHAVVKNNVVSGDCLASIATGSYGHDILIMDNDFSESRGYSPITLAAADTTFSGNTLGAVVPDGVPALVLYSVQALPTVPMPNPVENCVLMKNDYRLIGSGRPAIVLASDVDRQLYYGLGSEVKNNLIFETGRFPEETGGAQKNIQLITGLTNPNTGLPYVHDNRIVGHPASEIQDAGIGWIVRSVQDEGEE